MYYMANLQHNITLKKITSHVLSFKYIRIVYNFKEEAVNFILGIL